MVIPNYVGLFDQNEELLNLNQAGKDFRPPRSRATVERYIRDGVRGATLRTVKVGSQRFTTRSEIRRFTLAQCENPVTSSDDDPSE